MIDAVFVTGNVYKARYFNDMTGLDVEHVKLDVDEIQSLDIREVVEYKARQAYSQAKRPVIVEDTRLAFRAMGKLPGTYIKWFLDEVGVEGLCTMLDAFDDRSATAGAAIAYYDGTTLEIFESSLDGTIAQSPAGDSGFGWNRIFVPNGSDQTLGQMDDDVFTHWYRRIKPFNQLGSYIRTLTDG